MDATLVAAMNAGMDWVAITVSFVGALAVSTLWVLRIYWTARGGRPRSWQLEKAALYTPLGGLGASWSVHDSWATNIAAGSGLAVLFLGTSSALVNVLGTTTSTSQGAVNVITVAGAASVALTGAAGLLVLAIKTATDSDTTVFGLLAGTSVALGAAAGETWAVALGLNEVNLGQPAEVLKWFAALGSTALLAYYAKTSIAGLLTQGAPQVMGENKPKTPDRSQVGSEQTSSDAGAANQRPAPVAAPVSQSVGDVVAHALAIVQSSRDGTLDPDDAVTALEGLQTAAVNRAKLRQRSALP